MEDYSNLAIFIAAVAVFGLVAWLIVDGRQRDAELKNAYAEKGKTRTINKNTNGSKHQTFGDGRDEDFPTGGGTSPVDRAVAKKIDEALDYLTGRVAAIDANVGKIKPGVEHIKIDTLAINGRLEALNERVDTLHTLVARLQSARDSPPSQKPPERNELEVSARTPASSVRGAGKAPGKLAPWTASAFVSGAGAEALRSASEKIFSDAHSSPVIVKAFEEFFRETANEQHTTVPTIERKDDYVFFMAGEDNDALVLPSDNQLWFVIGTGFYVADDPTQPFSQMTTIRGIQSPCWVSGTRSTLAIRKKGRCS